MKIKPELIEHLNDFGLDEDSAMIYLNLLKIGPSKASDMPTLTNIPRIKSYRKLENLKKRGFVSSSFSNPVTYTANELKTSLKSVLEKKNFELQRLEKLASHLNEKFGNELKSQPQRKKNAEFNIISGRNNIYSHIIKMIKNSNSEIYIVTTISDLEMMQQTSVADLIQEKRKDGSEIKLITEIDGKKSELVNSFNYTNFKNVILPSNGRIICSDDETLVSGYSQGKVNPNPENDSAFVTNAEEMVKNMKCLCTQLWNSGKPIKISKKLIIKEN